MELANDRDRAMKVAKREPTSENILKAKSLRNEAKVASKRIREEFIKSKLEEHEDDPKKFWNEFANVILGNKSRSGSTFNIMDENLQVLSNNAVAPHVNDYFATIGQKLANKIDDPSREEFEVLNDILNQNFLDMPKLNIIAFTINHQVYTTIRVEFLKMSGWTSHISY